MIEKEIVVKFHDWSGIETPAEAEAAINQLLHKTNDSKVASLVPSIAGLPRGGVRELEGRADFLLNRIMRFFVVRVASASVGEVLSALRSGPTVELAYLKHGPTPPPVNPDDLYRSRQKYLDSAALGIGADYAWSQEGGDGKGIRFVDVERGWMTCHEDLRPVQPLSGISKDYLWHGSAVLGIVSAIDNEIGCLGIVPELDSIDVVSQWRTDADYNTADALASAIVSLADVDAGIILLEAQTRDGGQLLPVEVDPAVFALIQLATSLGIVVVEAAGNGGKCLDGLLCAHFEVESNRSLWDSGAILVGAASGTKAHVKMSWSNFGKRIDCFSWGEAIYTTFGNDPKEYNEFSGTSGAAAIVAGVAAAVQGIVKAKWGTPLSPGELRRTLADVSSGTPSATPARDLIGVMPNLKNIVGRINLGVVGGALTPTGEDSHPLYFRKSGQKWSRPLMKTSNLRRKDTTMVKGLLSTGVIALVLAGLARTDQASDESALSTRIAEFVAAWVKGDAPTLAAIFAPDGDLINPLGRAAKGRAEIERLCREEHASRIEGTHYNVLSVTHRFIGYAAAVQDLEVELTGSAGPDGRVMPPLKHRVTVVYAKKGGKWWAVAARPAVAMPPPEAPMK